MTRRELLQAVGAAGGALLASPAVAETGDLTSAAATAYIYGLPLIEMATTRKRNLVGAAVPNKLTHQRALIDHTGRWVTTPNNDTLYSIAWLDLTQGAASLTIPPTGRSYHSVALMDMFTNNNVVLGTRTTGNQGGRFTIVGPGQAGGGAGVVRVVTPHAWLLIRTLVDGAHDLDAAHQVQNGFSLEAPAAAPLETYAERDAAPADVLASVRRLLASDPAPATDGLVLQRMASALDSAARTTTEMDAIADGVAHARARLTTARGRPIYIDGWNYPRANLGDYGQDYMYRAAVALGGLGALPVAEAMYMRAAGDGETGRFNGDHLYRLSLPTTMPLDGFWSLTMYEAMADGQFFLTENSLKRYAIGDRTAGLKRNADGSVDLWIGRTDPGGDRTANWLPAPARGPFSLFMRCYLPKAEMMDGRWRLPPLRPV